MMMLFNLNAVNDFHLEDPEVLFRSGDLEVWGLKAEDCLFQPLQDKENKHTRMCLQFILIRTAPVFTLIVCFFNLRSVLCVLQFSYIFLYVPMMLDFIMMCHLCG